MFAFIVFVSLFQY